MHESSSSPAILLVDDDAPTRRRIANLIRDSLPDALVGDASSADAGITALASGPWELVILDLHMPDRSGLEALAEIKSTRPALPVIVLSGQPSEQYGAPAVRLGAAAYIMKDRAAEDLVFAIGEALQRPGTSREGNG